MKKDKSELLSAFLDSELNREQMEEVRSCLVKDSDAQDMLKDYQWQREQLHRVYDPVIEQPVPNYLQTKRAGGLPAWGQVAAGVMIFILGFASAWQFKSSDIDFSSTQAKVRGALNAHELYTKERLHVVEVKSDVKHLMPWLSARVGRKLIAPEYEGLGYVFLGGRLLTEGAIPAALLIYQDGLGNKVSLYISNSAYDAEGASYKKDQLNSFIWRNKQSTFILVGELAVDKLKNLATMTNHQVQHL